MQLNFNTILLLLLDVNFTAEMQLLLSRHGILFVGLIHCTSHQTQHLLCVLLSVLCTRYSS